MAGLAAAYGSGAMSNSMDDIVENSEAMLIIGSNTTEQHPVFGTKIRQAVRTRGVKLIVADPRKIDITEFATLHLQQKPGTDVALINGLMNIIMEQGWEDTKFIQTRTEGFEEFKNTIESYPPNIVSKITGISDSKLKQAAEILAKSKPMAVMWAMGITQHIVGVRNVMSLANLQMLLGNMGISGGGVNPLRGQNNVQGACDLGGLPNVYSGYQKVTSQEVADKFTEAWGAEMSLSTGMTITELIPAAGEGKVKALYIMGEDPIMSDPDSNHVRKCFENCEFVVLQEIFPSETTPYADVLLPGVSFSEKTGTYTNTERRIQMVHKAIEPIGEAREDWRIISDLAREIIKSGKRTINSGQYANWEYENSEQIMNEIAALTPSYAGVSHSRLEKGERLQWPVKNSTHSGTPILHVGEFTRGLGKFSPIEHIPPAEMPDDEFPMLFSTGRVLYHWHGGEMTRRAEGLVSVYGHSLIEINPDDAELLGITDGNSVEITSRRGRITARAWITERVPPGMIFANFHFPESPANELTIAALDPVAKIPEYKICAVKLKAIEQD